jgi:hypothetical protein
MSHAYPSHLADVARARWAHLEKQADPGPCVVRPGTLPESFGLERLLSIAYQASLLHEEDRPVRFRLLVGDPERLPPDLGPPEGLHALRFTEPRPYNEHEIRRLAPAAQYHRALIGVRSEGAHDFRIWGMLQSGPRWLQSARGGRVVPSPIPPDALVIRVAAPGMIAIGIGDVTLAELRNGTLGGQPFDTLEAKWLAARFAPFRDELLAEHERSMEGAAVPLDPMVTKKISQQLFKRVISILREAHHGGTLLLLPEKRVASLLGTGGVLRLKYAFSEGEARRRHRTLIRAGMRELSRIANALDPRPERAGWSLYQGSSSASIAALDEAILEVSHLLAALGDVDGAVVLTDRFELLGFGAEIVGPLPELVSVRRALDLEAGDHELVPIDGVGTRHRSAYRLCAEEPEALAIVVSHDGTVQFVAGRDGAVTYWDYMPSTSA